MPRRLVTTIAPTGGDTRGFVNQNFATREPVPPPVILQGPRQPLSFRARPGLGQENLRSARDVTIAGFALDGNDWDANYVGRRKGDNYVGEVDHGFDKQSSTELRKQLTPLIHKTQPYTKLIAHKGIWVEPELNAEIESVQNPQRERCGTRSIRACGRICERTPSIAFGSGRTAA
ncbi:hypothetical protein ACVWVY_003747 [Bradyrhizobium sp. URHC0002]